MPSAICQGKCGRELKGKVGHHKTGSICNKCRMAARNDEVITKYEFSPYYRLVGAQKQTWSTFIMTAVTQPPQLLEEAKGTSICQHTQTTRYRLSQHKQCVRVAACLQPLLHRSENEEKWLASSAMHLRLRTGSTRHTSPSVNTAELLLLKIKIYEEAYALAARHMQTRCKDMKQVHIFTTRYASSRLPVGCFINYYAAGEAHGMVAHIDHAAATTRKTNKVTLHVAYCACWRVVIIGLASPLFSNRIIGSIRWYSQGWTNSALRWWCSIPDEYASWGYDIVLLNPGEAFGRDCCASPLPLISCFILLTPPPNPNAQTKSIEHLAVYLFVHSYLLCWSHAYSSHWRLNRYYVNTRHRCRADRLCRAGSLSHCCQPASRVCLCYGICYVLSMVCCVISSSSLLWYSYNLVVLKHSRMSEPFASSTCAPVQGNDPSSYTITINKFYHHIWITRMWYSSPW
jgi:hypothetical protein